MTERIILDLPDDITHRAREKARRTGRQLEDVLTDWIKQGVSDQDSEILEYPIYTPLGNEDAAEILMRMSKETDTPPVIKKTWADRFI
jgi:hemerythrin